MRLPSPAWSVAALLAATILGGCRGRGEIAGDGLEASAAAALTGAATPATLELATAVATLRIRPSMIAVSGDAGLPPLVRVSELAPAAPADACPAIIRQGRGVPFRRRRRGRGLPASSPRRRVQ